MGLESHRGAIQEGLRDHAEKVEDDDSENKRREMIEVKIKERGQTHLDKILENENGEMAIRLKEILRIVAEGEQQVGHFEMEIPKETVRQVMGEIFERHIAFLDNNDGSRTVVSRGFGYGEDTDVHLIPANTPVKSPDGSPYGSPYDRQGYYSYDFSGKNFVSNADVIPVFPNIEPEYLKGGSGALTEHAVFEKAIKGTGLTVYGRKLEFDGKKLTMDFSKQPSASFFEQILASAVSTGEWNEEEHRMVHTFQEPNNIGEVKFMPVKKE